MVPLPNKYHLDYPLQFDCVLRAFFYQMNASHFLNELSGMFILLAATAPAKVELTSPGTIKKSGLPIVK
jgi:hypothetical protein